MAMLNCIKAIHKRYHHLPITFCLLLLTACSHHQPAPVEEQSASSTKSQVSADGSYLVGRGDTLYAIAFKYDVDPHDVAQWNDISSPYVIYPGQSLRLSPPSTNSRAGGASSGVQISTVKTPGRSSTRAVSTPTQSPQQKPVPAATSPPTASPTTASPPPTSTTPDKPATAKTGGVTASSASISWSWPTDGRLIRGYVAGNPARNGLDIAGKEGQSIMASSGGQVVYSGSGLIGYGELIIIKHSEKMLSAYAHNKQRLVTEGDQVSSGQKIAEMGRNPSGDQLLHFEIRVHGKPVNPLNYLPKK